jgi:hypothetical protein
MERCTDETDEDTCQMIWDERAAGDGIVRKTHVTPGQDLKFVMSDETPDLMDDVILSDGWDLEAFNKNPIALFGHKSDFIVGEWTDVHVRISNCAARSSLPKAPPSSG